ncbi:MAG: M20/M25/M40 family metallo-hydrolase, partial [Nanoarchaeota archaeon]|nr:M20/M25/M40 family metallo-hydrolase [Nanoarchaeota archaeon]
MDDAEHYFKRVMPSYQKQLVQLLRIPSISQKPEHRKDLLKIAQETAALAQSFGFKVQVIQSTIYSPGVVGKLEVGPGLPWLLIYNHLDVQPADEPEWNTKPFEPVIRETGVIARGATDDKGPMLATLYAIKYLHETKQLPVNVEIIYETYEENGSLGFDSLLWDALKKGLLVKPDSILVSDGVFLGEHPTIDIALRGLLKVKVSVQTASKNIHSGLGGGVVRNPLHILMTALSKCYDLHTGKVFI